MLTRHPMRNTKGSTAPAASPKAIEQRELLTCSFDTPLGAMTLMADETGLVAALFNDQAIPQRLRDAVRVDMAIDTPGALPQAARHWLHTARGQLSAYFEGGDLCFDLPLAPRGTAFQLQVWAALRGLRPGQTCSYGTLAAQLGRPQAMRAVGSAIGANPLLVIIPCHRVLSTNGQLTGFAAGLPRKQWLLAHESAVAVQGTLELQ